jgi:hypothetical protein
MDNDFRTSCEESIRQSPLPAVGLAALGGIVLSRLPVGALIFALLRLAFTLLRPALLVLGILKAVQLCKERHCTPDDGPAS